MRQTLTDWELIIIDSHSDDGSLEILEEYARKDDRIKIHQAPRDGIYINWNRGLKLCTGEYVYIATSDDTMTLDCIESMVAALSENPHCGVCHCCLEIIDESGRPVTPADSWENYPGQKYFGEWVHRYHMRRAPHDGLLHFGLFTVYTSLTQLLVRRRVYEDVGLFRTDCSTYADFEWGMRVGLLEDVVHVPRELATWRRHPGQATQFSKIPRIRARGEFHRLVGETLEWLRARNGSLAHSLENSRLNDYYLLDELSARRSLGGSAVGAAGRAAAFAAKHPVFFLRWLFHRVVRGNRIAGDFGEAVRGEFAKLGFGNLLQAVEGNLASPAQRS